ncbi:MAG TPA: hypothetical protein DCR12_05960, partial [Lachnospiraceae bacterium]|nr:hypothetical protein [Lachnospiraceae bacterium]
MSFDGSTIHELAYELNNELSNCKINKIAQPENEELLLTIKGNGKTNRLLVSSNASLPLIYLTNNRKESPLTAPNFCMVLRKYLNNGTIRNISQVDFERVIKIEIEHLDELKDLSTKYLYIEIMGKHSNIIFTDKDNIIIDSIKHISHAVSSIREVLPGRDYFIPRQENRINPLTATRDEFMKILDKPTTVSKAIYKSFVGVSPSIAIGICENADVDADFATDALSLEMKNLLYMRFSEYISDISNNVYKPNIMFENGIPKDYAPVILKGHNDIKRFDNMSELLESYYSERNRITNIKQRSSDIRKIVQIHIERAAKKLDIQKKQLDDTNNMDKFKLYGELLMTYGQTLP